MDVEMLVPGQLELFPSGPLGRKPPRYEQTLFFALRPPVTLAEDIYRLASTISARFGERRKTASANLHLTLNGVAQAASFDEATISGARTIGDAVAAPGFELVLDRLMSFGKEPPYPVVLACAEGASDVLALGTAIDAQMRRHGLRTRKASGIPHVTLWYGRTSIPVEALARPIRWTVDDFWLVHSHTGQGCHTWPGHWRLAG